MLHRRSLAIASILVALGAAAAACWSTTAAAQPSGPETTFGDGLHLVFIDIAPGTYVASGGTDCHWERLSEVSGNPDNDIIANDNPTGHAIVTISPNDKAFKSLGCGEWKKAPTSGTPKTSFGKGTWAVGIDIAPGTYKSSGGSGCYWARLSGFGGTFDQIITNGNPMGSTDVTIAPHDTGFVSKGCGEWTKSQTNRQRRRHS
jgi:hypothetical protein